MFAFIGSKSFPPDLFNNKSVFDYHRERLQVFSFKWIYVNVFKNLYEELPKILFSMYPLSFFVRLSVKQFVFKLQILQVFWHKMTSDFIVKLEEIDTYENCRDQGC